MCDYSLPGIHNRLAVEGEVLELHRFHTGSIGLTSPGSLDTEGRSDSFITLFPPKFIEPAMECAVIIPDGAQLVMTEITPDFQLSYDVSSTEVVTFRRISEGEGTHREVVEFRNGMFAALQEFEEGQRLGVLALSALESITGIETLNAHIAL